MQQDPWVRAGLAYNHFAVEISRGNDDANVMVLGTKVFGDDQALALVELWLGTPFKGRQHADRAAMISELESRNWNLRPNSDRNRGAQLAAARLIQGRPRAHVHQGPQRVAMPHHHHGSVRGEFRGQDIAPVRRHTFYDIRKALPGNGRRFGKCGVARIGALSGKYSIVCLGRSAVDAAAPPLNVSGAEARPGFVLDQALKRAIMPLIEPPVRARRQLPAGFLDQQAGRFHGPPEDGGVYRIGTQPREAPGRVARLGAAALGEGNVEPTGEYIVGIRDALTVAQQHQAGHQCCSRKARIRAGAVSGVCSATGTSQ